MRIDPEVVNQLRVLREAARIPVRVAQGEISAEEAQAMIVGDRLGGVRIAVRLFLSRMPIGAVDRRPRFDPIWVGPRAICVGVLTSSF